MYTIKLDGKPLYSPAMLGDKYRIMAPKLTLDISTNGELSFVLPPGNHMIDAIRRRKRFWSRPMTKWKRKWSPELPDFSTRLS